jgi:glycosyltransferase involved in cell wall biosynthesis
MEKNITISIVTATWNSASTLVDCLASVAQQNYTNREHVIVDGASTDGTLDVINRHIDLIGIFKSERDAGIYDALNKGFILSTGDVVGILHSDDIYYDASVLERVAEAFEDPHIDYVFGDIEMINAAKKPVRYWKAGPLLDGRITSTQIPHPSLFLSRRLLDKLRPPFDSSYRISADLKQQLIFANVLHAKGAYIPAPLVKMRIGGTSTANPRAYLDGWKESRRAWNEVHGSGGTTYVLKKVFSKLKGLKG